MSRSRWLPVVVVAASVAMMMGCATGLEADVDEPLDVDDNIDELDESDDPGLDDAYDFQAEYSLSEGIEPLRQLSYPNVRMFDGHGCTRSLARAGCAIASHAMLMDYYGQESTLPEHNSLLHRGSPHGHSRCSLVWTGGLAPGATYRGTGSGSLSSIKNELDNGSPVIAHVKKAGRSRCHHFVLITGYSNNGSHRADFEIMDPATGSKRNLSSYSRVCSTRLFDGTPQP